MLVVFPVLHFYCFFLLETVNPRTDTSKASQTVQELRNTVSARTSLYLTGSVQIILQCQILSLRISVGFSPLTPVFYLFVTRKVVNIVSIFAGPWPDLTQLRFSPPTPSRKFPESWKSTASLCSHPPWPLCMLDSTAASPGKPLPWAPRTGSPAPVVSCILLLSSKNFISLDSSFLLVKFMAYTRVSPFPWPFIIPSALVEL